MADGNSFVAVVNDTTTKLTRTTKNGKEKTYSPSYKTVISGNNRAQFVGLVQFDSGGVAMWMSSTNQ